MPKEKKYECYTCGLTGEREVFTGEYGASRDSWLKCPSCGVYNVYRAKDDPIWQRDQLITGGGPHEHAIRVFAEFHNPTRSYRGEHSSYDGTYRTGRVAQLRAARIAKAGAR